METISRLCKFYLIDIRTGDEYAKNCYREIDYENVRTREPTSVNRYDLLSRIESGDCLRDRGTQRDTRADERQHFPSDERAISRMKRTHPFPPADAFSSSIAHPLTALFIFPFFPLFELA